MRIITYAEAIREATKQEMSHDDRVVVIGLGVDDERGLLGTTSGLINRFGSGRVIDTPLAEEGMTGVSVGMALSGLRPIHTHFRMEFVVLALNQVINIAAKTHYMYGGEARVPMVIRVLIGSGWGAQHSQGLHSFFAHIPGLKVVAPTTPYDAKGCLISAIRDDNPVIFVEHFDLYSITGDVPTASYMVPIDKSKVITPGYDITIVGISGATPICLEAAENLASHNVKAEVVDAVSISPLDMSTILQSASKTRRVLIVDSAWTCCGVSSEIVARIHEYEDKNGNPIKCRRMGFAPVPCPTSSYLESLFYPDVEKVVKESLSMRNM